MDMEAIRKAIEAAPSGRAAGETFRLMLWALISASAGRNVLFESCHYRERDRVYRMAADIVSHTVEGCEFKRNRITFPNGCYVYFRASEKIRGTDALSVHFDGQFICDKGAAW